MPIQALRKIWMDGELVEWDRAQVHVLTHALQYGSGVFEGIRAYETGDGPAVFRLHDHMRRLLRSAHLYQMPVPYSIQELSDAVVATVAANQVRACYIRPLIYRSYGEMGLNPLIASVAASISAWSWERYLGEHAFENGVRAKISSWRRNDHNTLPPGAKATGQYINSGLAKAEVTSAGYDEAILLNIHGYVADGSGENVFIVRDGAVLTPPLSSGCLGGITRDSIMTIARDLGYQVHEQDLVRFDLYTADEAFFTGTAAELTPIREVDDRPVGANGRGPITKELQQTFFAATHGKVEQYRGWLTPVSG